MDARASASLAGYGVHSSKLIAISDFKHPLDAHRLLGRQEHRRAVDRGAETRALLGDLAHLFQAPYLKAAGVGENRTPPVHEAMQPRMRLDHLEARPQVQMEGIAENDLRADGFELLRRHGLDGAVRAHRHERRGFDASAREIEPPAPRRAVEFHEFEAHARARPRRGFARWGGTRAHDSPRA